MLKSLLSIIGFVPRSELDEIKEELKEKISALEHDNRALNEFFESAYSYFGGNPNWKAQQEFRDLVSKNAMNHADAIDDYLGALVDATRKCMTTRGQNLDFPWHDQEHLNHARGYRGWKRKFPKPETA